MAHTIQTSHSIITLAYNKIVNFVLYVNKAIAVRSMKRESYNQLASLSNRELSDIGLCRGDIMAVVNDTFYKDSIRTREILPDANTNLKGWS
jgi:uncharacterized protein YjiS (DUF1127 family)|tara:strand:- start:45 stop:320 length:276 start_codon:yes stop_codon:yes gene_type:complete